VGNQLFLNLLKQQLGECDLNTESQSETFYKEWGRVGREGRGEEGDLPKVHYFHILNPCIVCKDDCQRGPGKLVVD
jgi:hypothetical protein